MRRYINLQLIATGSAPVKLGDRTDEAVDAERLLADCCARLGLIEDFRCPADRRIEAFLRTHFADVAGGSRDAIARHDVHVGPLRRRA